MSYKEEWMKKMKEKENHLPIPEELDKRIQLGLEEAKIYLWKKQKRLQKIRATLASIAAICILIFASLATFKENDSMQHSNSSNNMHNGNIENPSADKELKENEIEAVGYLTLLNDKQTKGDITVHLKTVIANKNEAIVNYSISIEGDPIHEIMVSDEKLLNEDGASLTAKEFDPIYVELNHNIAAMNSHIVFGKLSESDKSGTWTFVVGIKKDRASATENFEFTIPVNEEWFEERVYTLNQIVEIGDMEIEIADVKISPLESEITIKSMNENDKRIVGIKDFVLVDNAGIPYASSGEIHFDHPKVKSSQIKLSHFSNKMIPDELDLLLKGIFVEDLHAPKITMDLNKEELINAPDGLELKSIEKIIDNVYNVILLYNGNYHEEPGLLEELVDENGWYGSVFVNSVTYLNNGPTEIYLNISLGHNDALLKPITFPFVGSKLIEERVTIPVNKVEE
jgi:hypothetical protein